MRKDKLEKGQHQCRSFNNKPLALVLACTLLIGGVVGGTVAWLTDKAGEVTNVFAPSDISIELKEHTYDPTENKLTEQETTTGVDNYKMVPGWTIPKDPWAKVSPNSEDCYLFVEIEGKNAAISKNTTGTYSLGDYIVYAVKSDWIALDETNYPNVFYKVIDDSNEKNVAHGILGSGIYSYDGENYTWNDSEVLTKPDVTKELLNAFDINNDGTLSDEEKAKLPTLTFTAYAIQYWKDNENAFSPSDAWNNVNPTSIP